MNNPIHPGEIVLHDCVEALGMTMVSAAAALGVTRQQLHRITSGTSAISPEMAIRLSQVFGSSPETWLRMQAAYDLAQLRIKDNIHLRRAGEAA
jgi:addiction module HigA family antidote